MKYGTVWDAWRLAEHRQKMHQEMVDMHEPGSKVWNKHFELVKKLERQGYRFVDKIIDLIAKVDETGIDA